jgi:hypothetical protein
VLAAAPEHFGPLSVVPPPGFTRNGSALVAGASRWSFDAELPITSPEAWLREAFGEASRGLRDREATPASHQRLPNGLEVWLTAGSGYDARGQLRSLMIIGAFDPSAHRLVPSRFETGSSERFNEERALVGTAMGSFSLGPASVPSAPAQAQAGALPDGDYACQLLSFKPGATAFVYTPAYAISLLGTISLRGGHYEASASHRGGRVERGAQLRFIDGPWAGWVAATGSNSTGPYFRVRPDTSGAPGDSTKAGDHLCFLQR